MQSDRDLMQQALDVLESVDDGTRYSIEDAITALRDRLAHCDRCGKPLGGEGDIHTCTPRADQIEDLICAMEYHVKQTRPIHSTTVAIQTARKALREPTVHFKCTVIDDQHPNGVPLEQWNTTPPAAPVQEPVPENFMDALKFDVAARDARESLYTTPPAAQPAATVEDSSQEWAGMSGRDAYMLIQRHADGWADVGKMMGEWLAANTPTAAQRTWVELTDEEVKHRATFMDKQFHLAFYAGMFQAQQILKEKNT